MIIKSKTFKNFTVIDNQVIKDNNLSLKAKGLYCILCSLPPDWKVMQSQLHQFSNDGSGATTSAFKELIEYGLIKVIGKDNKNTKWKGNISYVVFPNLESAEKFNLEKTESEETEIIDSSLLQNAILENPIMEKPILKNNELLNIYIQKKEEQKKELINKDFSFKEFMNFYFEFFKSKNNFPPKITAGDGKALKEIIKYLQECTGSDLKAFESWQYILTHWNELSVYTQNKMRLVDINSNIQNILIELKNNHSKKNVTSGNINKNYNSILEKLIKEKNGNS